MYQDQKIGQGGFYHQQEIEFWLNADNRIHERLKYYKNNNGNWKSFYLNP